MKKIICTFLSTFILGITVFFDSAMAAMCTKASAGQYCVWLQLKDCAPGCYCTGGSSFAWTISDVPKGCSERWSAMSDIEGNGVHLCPSDFPSSDSGANAATSCYYTYNGTKIYNKSVSCPAGQYMPANSNNCATCPANSWCPGGTYHTGRSASGINSCSSSYPYSASSSSAQTACYRNCTTSDVTYSSAVSGKYYYNNNNQCSATSCQIGTELSSGHCNRIAYNCSSGQYLATGATACTTCPAGSYCGGGGYYYNASSNQGINNCANEIAPGWSSDSGKGAKTDCFYPITLNKNGFSGTISAGAGTGCQVASSATGTNSATLRIFYNTSCTLPSINLSQTGFATAVGWSLGTAIGDSIVTTIAATTITPNITTYYARKTGCAQNYYKTGTTTCAACGANSNTENNNIAQTCNCDEGYSLDGTANGEKVSTTGCIEIGKPICSAGKYVPANTASCETCPVGSWCPGGQFLTDSFDQGINSCVAEIASGWSSDSGKSAKTDCYYPITLNKNGFSGTISAGAGTGCQVVSDATGANSATLRIYYNTSCTLPAISLSQTGYVNATGWVQNNIIGPGQQITTIAGTTTTPSITTYYAHKTGCSQNYYKTDTTTCAACGANSTTENNNVVQTCNCDVGYSSDGAATGAANSTSGCSIINVNCSADFYLPANSAVCSTCPGGYNCSGGIYSFNLTTDQGINPNTISITWDNDTNTSCVYDGTFVVPTPPSRTGYVFTGWKLKSEMCSLSSSVCGLNIDAIDNLEVAQTGAHSNDGVYTYNSSNYGLTSPGTWAVEFTNGDVVRGIASCNTTVSNTLYTLGAAVTNETMTMDQAYNALWRTCDTDALQPSNTFSASDTGTQCWCKMTSYTPNSGSACDISSPAWVYLLDTSNNGSSFCAEYCVDFCSYYVGYRDQFDVVFREAVLTSRY